MASRDVTGTYHKLEQRAIAFHEVQAADAAGIFRDGFGMLLDGIDPLRGLSFGAAAEQRLTMALFINTMNSLRCFYDVATRGYFTQALHLLRTPVEDWLSYWFVRNFPERHVEFTTAGMQPPPFDQMLETIDARHESARKQESRAALAPDPRVRFWLTQLHQHLDPGRLTYHLGPEEDEGRFRQCTGEAVQVIGGHLEALDNFRKLISRPRVPGVAAYLDRVEAWQQSHADAAEHVSRGARLEVRP